MAERPLSEAERALWQRLVATVEPLHAKRVVSDSEHPQPVRVERSRDTNGATKSSLDLAPDEREKIARPPGNLDSHWDRRIDKGRIEPDATIDLHGMNLAAAYARLDAALELAIASGQRAILLIAGKPRAHDRASGEGRGAIRAALDDWLHASRHASHIAAVRNAHPRHGGAGALYIILKRRR